MSDDADAATVLAEAEREATIRSHLARPRTAGSTTCLVCGDDIPFERRAAVPGTTHCIDCAERLERLRRTWRTSRG